MKLENKVINRREKYEGWENLIEQMKKGAITTDTEGLKWEIKMDG